MTVMLKRRTTRRPVRAGQGPTASPLLCALLCSVAMAGCSGDDPDGSAVSGTPPVAGLPGDDPGTVEPPSGTPPGTTAPGSGAAGVQPVDPPAALVPDATDLAPSAAPYRTDGYGQGGVIRADVRTVTGTGPCTEDDQSGCTFDDLRADVDNTDDFKVTLPAHFAADDFPDDGTAINATLRQRGNSARAAEQKSFRVRFDDKDAIWRGERRLLLNKHPFENSRVRNRLSMDLMSELPYLESMRTQFVNLWIDDGRGPVDHGLFTHVEAAGKEFLENRAWHPEDRIYKSESFRFSAADLEAVAVDDEGEPKDLERFERRLEIETGKDHSRLVSMLQALDDPEQDFATVFERHFDADNVLAWVTVNFLLGQKDATTHNFYLYNPVDSETFYFMPWDYDATFYIETELADDGFTEDQLEDRLSYGYARGAKSVLLDNFYRLPGTHDAVLALADRLRAVELSDETLARVIGDRARVARPFVMRSPDDEFVPNIDSVTRYDDVIRQLPTYVAANAASLRNDFGIPLPPVLQPPVTEGETTVFAWRPAFDVTGHTLTYDLEVSTSGDFASDDVAYSVFGLPDARHEVTHTAPSDELPAGTLYYRVIARSSQDPKRFWQVGSNKETRDGQVFRGQVEFSVP